MFNNLCALAVEYSDRRFPKINLSIINTKFKDSPLHLGNKCVASIKKINKEDEFDFDISMLKPLEDDEEKIIDFDISLLKPLDDIVPQHKR